MAKVGYKPRRLLAPMAIPDDLLDTQMKDYKNPEGLIGETCLLRQLASQLLEQTLQSEMTEYLAYE